jgi:hypothetical protein
MEHIKDIMAHMIESDHYKPVIHYCPVEKRTVDSDYCDSLPREDEDNTDVDTDPSLIAGRDPADVRSDMNYELLCEKYFD